MSENAPPSSHSPSNIFYLYIAYLNVICILILLCFCIIYKSHQLVCEEQHCSEHGRTLLTYGEGAIV